MGKVERQFEQETCLTPVTPNPKSMGYRYNAWAKKKMQEAIY